MDKHVFVAVVMENEKLFLIINYSYYFFSWDISHIFPVLYQENMFPHVNINIKICAYTCTCICAVRFSHYQWVHVHSHQLSPSNAIKMTEELSCDGN